MALEEENIESRPIWKPMHMQPVFDCRSKSEEAGSPREMVSEFHGVNMEQSGKRRYQARVVGGEVAEDLFKRGLCLPSGTALTETDLNRVIDVIKRCHR